ncbi:MAG: chromate transporter [Alphaproteobacteria bacterium]
MKLLFEIFWSFFKVTISSFGGGYVLIPLLQEEIVRKRKWINEDDLINYYALGQCTPGIISMNVAMFTGYKVKGMSGSLVGAFAVSCPCIIFISLVFLLLKDYFDNEYVKYAINGVKVFMIALIFHTIIDLYKKAVKGKRGITIFLFACALIYLLNLDVAWVIVVSGFAGYLINLKKIAELMNK